MILKPPTSEVFELLTSYGRTHEILFSSHLIEDVKECALEIKTAKFTKNLAFIHKIENKYIASIYMSENRYFQVIDVSEEKQNLDEVIKEYLTFKSQSKYPFYYFNDFGYDSFKFFFLVDPKHKGKTLIISYTGDYVEMLGKREDKIIFDPQLCLGSDFNISPMYFDNAKEATYFLQNKYYGDTTTKKFYLVNGETTFKEFNND